MQPKRPRTRFTALRAALLAAGALSLALAAGAAAVVYVYSNNFSSKTDYQEVKQTGGGNDCGDSHRQRSRALRIGVRSDVFCEYSPPVTGDADRPDQQIVVAAKVLKSTPRALRRAVYVAVRIRVGGGNHYELLIKPNNGKYVLSRSPGSAGLPLKGRSNAIKRVGGRNKLLLKASGNQIRAVVNGRLLASFFDPNSGEVLGRRTAFGFGSTKDGQKNAAGLVTNVRVGIP